MGKSLIIFDCDGTLVDSETLYNSITSELLTEMGLPEYTTERCIELFAGQSWRTIKDMLEDTHRIEIPESMVDQFVEKSYAGMDSLNTSEDAHDVVGALHQSHKICVASNGERGGVLKSLAVTGLDQYFPEHHIFTKIQVERPKPAPDLFLFTAEQMGFEPPQCLVIEDSPTGVIAAVAAGIHVIGYTGCSHDTARQADMLHDAGADIVTDNLNDIIKHI